MTSAVLAKSGRGIVYAARVGYAAKGVVYAVLGVLALRTAFGESGGKLTDSKGAIEEIGAQPFGQVMLWAIALGLVCYAIWNVVRAALDPERRGRDGKGALQRAGYAASGFFHLMLAVYAAQVAVGSSRSSGNTQTWVAKLMELPLGPVLVALVGAIAIVFGLVQVRKAIKGKVGEQYAAAPLSPATRRMSKRVARVGVFARGLVFPVIGGSLVAAALSHDPGEADGFGQALGKFAQGPFGSFALAFIAAGLLAYGIHLFFVARYGRLPEPH